MSRYLYRFTCKPNYPVISAAAIVFHTAEQPSNFGNVLAEAKALAGSAGCSYTDDQCHVVYLGMIEVSNAYKLLPILYCVTGEY